MKVRIMKISLDFLKPRLVNVLLTIVVLCLPFLREQYKGGEYVTWHRPVELMIQCLQNPQNKSYFQLFIGLILFSLVVYVLTSALIAWVEKIKIKGLKIS